MTGRPQVAPAEKSDGQSTLSLDQLRPGDSAATKGSHGSAVTKQTQDDAEKPVVAATKTSEAQSSEVASAATQERSDVLHLR